MFKYLGLKLWFVFQNYLITFKNSCESYHQLKQCSHSFSPPSKLTTTNVNELESYLKPVFFVEDLLCELWCPGAVLLCDLMWLLVVHTVSQGSWCWH